MTMTNKFNTEVDALDKDYKDPVEFTIGSGSEDEKLRITWTPGTDLMSNLSGDTEVSHSAARSVQRYIEELYVTSPGNYIAATPVGPFLAGKIDDLPTVVYAINTIYSDFDVEVSGDAPTMADLMLDESTNVDEDGNTVVR